MRRSGPGQPKIDDREQVLGFVSARLAQGMNLSQATRPGLKVCGYETGPDGVTKILTVLRTLSALTLERRYRELRKELDEALEWQKSDPCLVNARYLGVPAPNPPLAYGEKPRLKRGRPRKNRRR